MALEAVEVYRFEVSRVPLVFFAQNAFAALNALSFVLDTTILAVAVLADCTSAVFAGLTHHVHPPAVVVSHC